MRGHLAVEWILLALLLSIGVHGVIAPRIRTLITSGMAELTETVLSTARNAQGGGS